MAKTVVLGLISAVCYLLFPPVSHAVTFVQGASLSSSEFRILDSQHAGFKSSASSDNFRLLSTVGDVAIGSSSGTNFGLRSGFLYYPLVIAPTLTSATAGNASVSLVWEAAVLDAGWTLSGYNVCRTPGTCVDVGNVTSYSVTGLTNGTSYTFTVQAKEIFGNVVAESNALSATPTSGATPTPTPGGGGGGGGGGTLIGNRLELEGYAYPDARVTILRDGVLQDVETADNDGTFTYAQQNITSGTYTYGFWAEDENGRRSVVLSIPLTFSGYTVRNVDNVVIAPTIEFTTADSVQPGGTIGIRGAATPNSRVRIRINPGNREYTVTATGNGIGTYAFSVPTTGFPVGAYDISARTELTSISGTSQYSQLLPFGVGVPAPEAPAACGNDADINNDTRVNLIDFSILAYWWRRTPLPQVRPFDLNCDAQVRLDDFSILAYHWTG